jgi:hypothetical protein
LLSLVDTVLRRIIRALRGEWLLLFKGVVFLEAGASILFFGLLANDVQLERAGLEALAQLQAKGYVVPSESDPVRVYDGGARDGFGPVHAGGWRPGTIALRQNPTGSAGPDVYLRHELMHEAGFRTCGGKLPLWAEEAAAINFSGEIGLSRSVRQPSTAEIDHLKERIRIGAPIDPSSYQTLTDLVSLYGWPPEPCAVSSKIEEFVASPLPRSETGFSYILVNLSSGRILQAKGDQHSRYAPGSLLKIPYAASLTGGPAGEIGKELAASDTGKLALRKGSLDPVTLRLLLSPAGDTALGDAIRALNGSPGGERAVRACLGEREEEGSFPFQAKLKELALVVRASLLCEPGRFPGLSRNGFAPGTTLYPEPAEYKQILDGIHAMSKTGTVSDARGNPLAGHLMVAWPAERPVMLAVFRTIGGNGGSNLRRASKLLELWSARFPVEYATVRVSVMTLTPRDTWEIVEECPSFERPDADGSKTRVSTCGGFRILSSARGSRTERCVPGILHISHDNQKVVLETDSESYADAVLDSEAQDLRGESRKALRAVIAWNGVHGGARHPETQSVCDSTHCMVYMGNRCGDSKANGKTDVELLRLLDEIAGKMGLDWLPFSKGGSEPWEVRIVSGELTRELAPVWGADQTRELAHEAGSAGEQVVLDMRRERGRNGMVSIHIFHAGGGVNPATGEDSTVEEDNLPCDVFRRYIKLPSCPESIRYDGGSNDWVFKGTGEGHGIGLSVEEMGDLERSGMTAAGIIEKAYLRQRDGRATP